VPSKSIIPNWLFADLITVPVGFSRVAAVDVALGSGELKLCDCSALVAAAVCTGTLGVPPLLLASPVQPTSRKEHAASSAMMRIRIHPFR
jgi:hypothetical protein